MPRARHSTTASWLLPLTVTVFVITSLLPAKFSTPWVRPLGTQTVVVFAPLSQLFNTLGQVFTPPKQSASALDAEAARERIDDLETRNRQLEQRNQSLRDEIDRLTRGGGLLPDNPVRLIKRPVLEPGGALMRVRGGSGDGVTLASIATAGTAQLVGRVIAVDARSATIQPITARATPRIDARILTDSAQANGIDCQLYAGNDGSLIGDTDAGEQVRNIEIGQTVVLVDPDWPAHAQMFVIGQVTQIENSPISGTRKMVTVTPTVAINRVAEVYLRIPLDESADGTNETEGSPG